jgi:hypothetical protein
MPTIFAKSGSYGVTMSWNDPNTWIGGIAPTASDIAVIRGLGRFHFFETSSQNLTPDRTNFAENQLNYWEGNKKTLLMSTFSTTFNPTASGIPQSGSIYTWTSNNHEVKIDYAASSSTFLRTFQNVGVGVWCFELYSCSIDTNYFKWSKDIFPNTSSYLNNRTSSEGGSIFSPGNFAHFKDVYVALTGSETASIFRTFVDVGGTLEIKDSASLALRNVLYLNDGYMYVKDHSSILWNNHYLSSSANPSNNDDVGAAINIFNSNMQTLIIEGNEVRSNTRLSSIANKEDTYLNVNDASQFRKGDPIFVGTESIEYSREDNGFYSNGFSFSTKINAEDEVFYVASVDTGSNRLYVQRFNGLEGVILASSSATEYFIDEQRFKIGDKIVVNNQPRTIVNIDYDQDLELRDYNFQSGSTLADWETDVTRSNFFNNWDIYPGVGLVKDINRNDRRAISSSNLSGFRYNAFNHTYVKDLILDEVKVEAWISNHQINNDFTSSYNYFGWHGIALHADPSLDWSEGYQNDMWGRNIYGVGDSIPQDVTGSPENWTTQNIQFNKVKNDRTRFGIIPRQNRYFFNIRQQYGTNKHSMSTASIELNPTLLANQRIREGDHQNIQIGDVYNIPQLVNPSGSDGMVSFPLNGLKKLTAEYSRGMFKGYINDVLVFEDIAKIQAQRGRVGVFAESTDSFTCTRFKVYRKCAKVTLDSSITANIGDSFLETGVEFLHNANDQVIKLASIITDVKGHKNLAFYLNGSPEYDGDGNYPYVYGINNPGIRAFNVGYSRGDFTTLNYLLNNSNEGVFNTQGSSTTTVGTTTPNRSFTIDLGKPVDLNTVGFVEDFVTPFQDYVFKQISVHGIGGIGTHFSRSIVSISGSLDSQTWFELTSSNTDSRYRMGYHELRGYSFPLTQSRYIRIDFGSGSVLRNGAPLTTHRTVIRSIYARNIQDYGITVNNASDLNVGDRIMIMGKNAYEPIMSSWEFYGLLGFFSSSIPTPTFLNYQNESGSFRDYFTIISKSGDDIYLDREHNYGYLEKGDWVFKVNRTVNVSGSYSKSEWKTGQIYFRGSTSTQSPQGEGSLAKVVFKNVGFQHQSNAYPHQPDVDKGIFVVGRSTSRGFNIKWEGCSFYNAFPVVAGNTSTSYNLNQLFSAVNGSGYVLRHNTITGLKGASTNSQGYIEGTSHGNGNLFSGGVGDTDGGSHTPSIVTGNILFGGINVIVNYPNSSRSFICNTSYNIISSWYSFLRADVFGLNPAQKNTSALTYFRVNRNLFLYLQQHPIGSFNYTGPYNKNMVWDVKNNMVCKVGSLLSWGEIDTPAVTTMLSKTGTHNQKTYYSSSGYIQYVGNDARNQGFSLGYIKDHNRWGYDITQHYRGWLIKEYNSEWSKFYNFRTAFSMSWHNTIYQAEFWVGEETASFTLGFDYYHSYNQVSQFDFSQSMFSGSGAIGVYANRNGISLIPDTPVKWLKKSTIPQRHEETFQLIGPASFKIGLSQTTLSGYVAFKNLTSTFSGSEGLSYMVKNNFNEITYRPLSLNQPMTSVNKVSNTSKFRLKGGRMF